MAQLLDPIIYVGKKGVSDDLIRGLNEELERRELVKVKFSAFKEQKVQLTQDLVEKTSSLLVSRVGNVAVLFRRSDTAGEKSIELPD